MCMAEKSEMEDEENEDYGVEPESIWMACEIVEDSVGLLECLGSDSMTFLL